MTHTEHLRRALLPELVELVTDYLEGALPAGCASASTGTSRTATAARRTSRRCARRSTRRARYARVALSGGGERAARGVPRLARRRALTSGPARVVTSCRERAAERDCDVPLLRHRRLDGLLPKQLGERYGEALADHHRLLRAAFARHMDGQEIDTQGDAFFLVAFRHPPRTPRLPPPSRRPSSP